MPNISDPSSLSSGIKGIYYVKGAGPKFYDGSVASFISYGEPYMYTLSGNDISVGTSYVNIVSIPSNSCGSCFVWVNSGNVMTSAVGRFTKPSSSAGAVLFTSDSEDVGMKLTLSGSSIQAKLDSGNTTHMSFVLTYYPP